MDDMDGFQCSRQDEMTSLDYSERRISLDMTPLSCKSTDSSAECQGWRDGGFFHGLKEKWGERDGASTGFFLTLKQA